MEILYSDNRIVAAIKPCGVLSTDEDGGMPQLLREALGCECVRTVHRLDAAVSGVTVYARSKMAASILSQQLRDGRFRKEYLAVIHGKMPEKEGTLRDILLHDSASRTTSVVSEMQKNAKQAVLFYRVLSEKDDISLLQIELLTGRTHQIRVQLSSRGHPLVGDRKYGLGEDCGIALWSYRVGLLHPQSMEKVEFSHLPPDQFPWDRFEVLKT